MGVSQDQALAVQFLQPATFFRILADRNHPETAGPKRPVSVGKTHAWCGEHPALGADTHLVSGQLMMSRHGDRMVMDRNHAVLEFRLQKLDLAPAVRGKTQL